jgi:hypothetical protein
MYCNQCNVKLSGHIQPLCLLSEFNHEEHMPDYYCSKKCLVLFLGGSWNDNEDTSEINNENDHDEGDEEDDDDDEEDNNKDEI